MNIDNYCDSHKGCFFVCLLTADVLTLQFVTQTINLNEDGRHISASVHSTKNKAPTRAQPSSEDGTDWAVSIPALPPCPPSQKRRSAINHHFLKAILAFISAVFIRLELIYCYVIQNSIFVVIIVVVAAARLAVCRLCGPVWFSLHSL